MQTKALVLGDLFQPQAAVEAGFLDQITDPDKVLDVALEEAYRLSELPQTTFAAAPASSGT
jgi:enoyl-CoA hydratase/carnithine racemase